jgi:hypothetical protein
VNQQRLVFERRTEQLDPRYAAARDLLWAAPCDLADAQARVDEYVRTINQMMHGVN